MKIGGPLDDAKLAELIARKAAYYQDAIRNHVAIFPGVKNLITKCCRQLSPRRRLRCAAPGD